MSLTLRSLVELCVLRDARRHLLRTGCSDGRGVPAEHLAQSSGDAWHDQFATFC